MAGIAYLTQLLYALVTPHDSAREGVAALTPWDSGQYLQVLRTMGGMPLLLPVPRDAADRLLSAVRFAMQPRTIFKERFGALIGAIGTLEHLALVSTEVKQQVLNEPAVGAALACLIEAAADAGTGPQVQGPLAAFGQELGAAGGIQACKVVCVFMRAMELEFIELLLTQAKRSPNCLPAFVVVLDRSMAAGYVKA